MVKGQCIVHVYTIMLDILGQSVAILDHTGMHLLIVAY